MLTWACKNSDGDDSLGRACSHSSVGILQRTLQEFDKTTEAQPCDAKFD